MTNDARTIRAPGSRLACSRLVWSREAPIASLVAVPGTPCRCTVSRPALESMAGIRRLGPSACLDMVDRFRGLIEAIAARKYLREGAGPDRWIHVTSADVADAVAAPTLPEPAAAHAVDTDVRTPPQAGIAA